MRKFSYVCMDGHHVLTEKEIIDAEFPLWVARMHSVGLAHRISVKNFLDDWCAVNWASEIKEDQ